MTRCQRLYGRDKLTVIDNVRIQSMNINKVFAWFCSFYFYCILNRKYNAIVITIRIVYIWPEVIQRDVIRFYSLRKSCTFCFAVSFQMFYFYRQCSYTILNYESHIVMLKCVPCRSQRSFHARIFH